MDTIKTKRELKANIDTFETYRESSVRSEEHNFYKSLIRRGKCFVPYKKGKDFHFCPSRFIGYKANNLKKHENNSAKDGKKTNLVIAKVLNNSCELNDKMEQLFRRQGEFTQHFY